MIILRTKSYALLEKKQYYKNNWDRLKHGWFGTSKESVDKYNNYVSKHNAEEKKLSGLLKNNPRQYLIDLYNLDTVTKRLGEFEKMYGIRLPQEIYKYVDAIKSFAGPLKNWMVGKDDQVVDHILRTDNIIYRLDSGLSEKYDSVESYRKDIEGDGEIVLMSNIEYDYYFIYNTNNNTWHVTYSNTDVNNLKDLILPFLKHEIEDNENYRDENAVGRNEEYSKELRKLWYNHVKSKL
jgi:hypothetical protein